MCGSRIPPSVTSSPSRSASCRRTSPAAGLPAVTSRSRTRGSRMHAASEPGARLGRRRLELRALEIEADVMLKATKVDGIYESDPMTDPSAKKIERLDYLEALNHPKIQVMDSTALTLCMDNNLPIIVFDLLQAGNIQRVVQGDEIGTLVAAREPAKA